MNKDVGVVRNSTYMFVGIVLGAGFSYLFTILMVRFLGTAGYAPIGLMVSGALLIAGVFKSGISFAIAKFIAEFEAQRDEGGIKAVLRQSIYFTLVITGLLLAALIVLAPFLAAQLFGADYLLYAALVVTLVFQLPWSLFNGIFQGFRQIWLVSLLQATGAVIQLLVAAVAIGLLQWGVWAGVSGVTLGPVVIFITGSWFTWRLIQQWGWSQDNDPRVSIARLTAFALPVAIINGAAPLMVNISPMLLQSISSSPEELGSYTALLVLIQGPIFLSRSFFIPVFPYLVKEGLSRENVGYFRNSLALFGGGSVLFVIAATWIGPAVLRLIYGPTLLVSHWDVLLLSLTMAFQLLSRLISQALIARSLLREATLAALGGILSLGLILLLIQVRPLIRLELSLTLSSLLTLLVLLIPIVRGSKTGLRVFLKLPAA